eukprot:CAMPEP_0184339944 /NCGR_PEP_ID=MMETSP1089-20130417/8620_1 /TAXON_ID=38269 ORGANISM="Gloeochaete wittrockiana, Strain SAG46.84" /NCGR_SAMPLE_ID=MMETSP1089 /ASSEMBLY_ACC=CAM_ASM_000445 /LENGTH=608 /DNA_ID=CAMNT_0026667489 /DNA_START=42 /DNA_END=1868 /DNA_ORIENTATION=-
MSVQRKVTMPSIAFCLPAWTSSRSSFLPKNDRTTFLGVAVCSKSQIRRKSQSREFVVVAEAAATSYDYVVVGAGAAGCCVANRLTEDANVKVLLIEAGKVENSIYIKMPIGFPYVFGSQFDWGFKSTNTPTANNRNIYLPRGKLMGGSHAISVMVYQRGDHHDYEKWENAGNAGWGPEGVLPYFIKMEGNQRGASRWHGASGPVSVSDAQLNITTLAFLRAAADAGLPRNEDFNWEWKQEGFGPFQVFQKFGRRCTPYTAYIEPIKNRTNLTIVTGAMVSKVEMDGTRATGVSYVKDGKQEFVAASKEVILSAGAVQTPQVLMLSGIGPKEELDKFSIPVVADLKGVGQNLMDHPVALLSYVCKTNDSYSSSTPSIPNFLNWFLFGKGPLRTNVCEAGGFLKTQKDLESCDVQLRFVPFKSEFKGPYDSFLKYAEGGGFVQGQKRTGPGLTIQVINVRPHSKGSVSLKSADPADRPVIDSGYLKDDRDIASILSGIKLVRQLMTSSHFDQYRGDELWPGTDAQSDEDIKDFIRDSAHTANALVGTAKMGLKSDPLSVVDSTLKVHGIQGLRVVDASIMPFLPGAQTGAPAMMIAEKASDIIKREAVAV